MPTPTFKSSPDSTSTDKDSADPEPPAALGARLRRLLIGPPRDVTDRTLYHRISLVAFLAWVGLGADGLSSSAYGPEEAFRALGAHTYLAIALAIVVATTVLVISAAYSRIIEQFPHGGGGYVVATKLLGKHPGIVSGCALLVDYVLTITISVAAAGDALFSLLPLQWHVWKLASEVGLMLLLTLVNLRGVRESTLVLAPIFLLFLATHAVLIGAGILLQAPQLPATLAVAGQTYTRDVNTMGLSGLALLLVYAYSLGGGTYTGIEAVSNGVTIMREPRVQTAQRTMVYMGTSLAITAAGLLLCYLLWNVGFTEGKTLNAVLSERVLGGWPFGQALVIATLCSEGALLVVASQAGFTDGPRVLANMAVDSWMPRRLATLSERLTTQNGILMMGTAALAALLFTGGDVRQIVVMYSINVFLTFSLSMLGMLRHTVGAWRRDGRGLRRIGLFGLGFAFCAVIMTITVSEKFGEGGWITLVATGCVISLAYLIRRHYDRIERQLDLLYRTLTQVPPQPGAVVGEPDARECTAGILVKEYGGLGLHTLLGAYREFPHYFGGVVFLSVGVIDSKEFKGEDTVDSLRESLTGHLERYVAFARSQGIPAIYRMAIGTDPVAEAERLCLEAARDFPQITFFAGKVVFGREAWYQRVLHNETALAIQKRLQWAGRSLVVVPAKLA